MEMWKTIEGFENYKVSNLGNIKITANSFSRKEKNLKPLKTKKGYFRVGLYKNKKCHFKSIHRLVAKCFIDNPENKKQVNHIDGDKSNNAVNNLEWCSYRENMNHAINNNLTPCGEKNGNSKLEKEDVIYIYNCLKIGVSMYPIMEKFNVSKSTVMGIKTGKQWSFLNLTPIKGRASSVTLEQILTIENLLKNCSMREVSRITGNSRELIKKVKNGYFSNLKSKLIELQNL